MANIGFQRGEKMYIIIAGVGVIGQEITEMLLENKHDVVAVDKDDVRSLFHS